MLSLMAKEPRVAVLIESPSGYERAILGGIARFAQCHGPWEIFCRYDCVEQYLSRIAASTTTGIIAKVDNARMAERIVEMGLPAVVLDHSDDAVFTGNSNSQVGTIIFDSHSAAQMAAEHLMSRHVKHFGFVGDMTHRHSKSREIGFSTWLREKSIDPIIYQHPKRKHKRTWPNELPTLAEWLSALPKPIGILACNDDRGSQVLDACAMAQIIVPGEAIVIGMENDELTCELSAPPLTSISVDAESAGFRAAALLNEMMRGKVHSLEYVVVSPLQVVERRSTEFSLSIVDREVLAALEMIYALANRPIRIADITAKLRIARRTLEVRFRKAVGRSLNEELRRARLCRAQRLMLESEITLAEVAYAAGFSTQAHFTNLFKKQFGKTPLQYRRLNSA